MTIDERLRQAARDTHEAARQVTESAAVPGSVWPRVAVAAVAFVAVFALATPLLLSGGTVHPETGGETPTATPPATTPETVEPDTSEIPAEVRAYWALEGTLESVGDEPGWLCPPKPSVGYTETVGSSAIPYELAFELPGEQSVTYLRDDGPVCNQPPALVMLAFTDEAASQASAGLAVWPSTTRYEDTCPPETCSTDIENGQALQVLTINGQPARLFEWENSAKLWWVDSNGVPAYAEASGLTRQELLNAAESISFHPVEHTAIINREMPAGLEVVHQEASQGVWEQGVSQMEVYDIDGASIAVRTQFDSSQTPYSRYASNVTFLELAEVDGTPAAWIPEGGNFLILQRSDNVIVYIEGAASPQDAIQIAEDLQ